ncbi:MAG: hypothetical protein CMO55_21910 [Verrucomicrobiales bacterium]|nr:hypothetical protein [Verrucomicrobiales bacterium]
MKSQIPECFVSSEIIITSIQSIRRCVLFAVLIVGLAPQAQADNADIFAFEAFQGFSARPAIPEANMILSSDGLLYGTTSEGGANNSGTIFRMATDGSQFETLVHFSYNGSQNKGAAPLKILTEWADMAMNHYLYGTTAEGGENGNGTIFRTTPTGDLETSVDFTGTGGSFPGSHPEGELLHGNDGNFYGTTRYGGTNDEGVIFRLSPTGTFTVLFEFDSSDMTNNGAYPRSAPTNTATTGVFVGTTSGGGDNGDGTVFKIDSYGTVTTLVHFSAYDSSNPGAALAGPLLLASDGDFYGTTETGGDNSNGTIFTITPVGSFTRLFEFPLLSSYPYGLIEGSDGHFYGVCEGCGFPLPIGGVTYYNYGNVFQYTSEGSYSVLVDFYGDDENGTKGRYPMSSAL